VLSLTQTNLVSELATQFYDLLPASSPWGTYTFGNAAKDAGVGGFWLGGSKLPAVTTLLERTLADRSEKFVPLVEIIVQNGLKRLRSKGAPMTREQVAAISRLVHQLGFPYSKLDSETFLSSLPTARPATPQPPPPNAPATEAPADMVGLCKRFIDLQALPDRQVAGLALESLLTDVFNVFHLEPRAAFRVVGEQIDGSFVLDGQVYVLEAKWQADRVAEQPLLAFRGKVEGKSAFTRGLFISINGYSDPAVHAITQGKQPNFVMIDGAHLFRVLDGGLPLDQLLRRQVRLLSEEGRPYVPVSELA
jgi:hypothetical protein